MFSNINNKIARYKNYTWNEMAVVSEDEKDFLNPNQKDYNMVNHVNSQRRSIEKDVTTTNENENITLQQDIFQDNKKNSFLQKQLCKEQNGCCKEKDDLLKDSKMKIESIKKSNMEEMRKIEEEHRKKTDILVADIEQLVAVVEQKDQEISQMSATIEVIKKNNEMLQSEIDILKSEVVDHKQKLVDVTHLARFSRKLVQETEKESLKVLHQNEILKLRIDELVFTVRENNEGVFPLHHQLQPHPSECDLQIDNNDCHNNKNSEDMGIVVLPDKFNVSDLLN